AAGQDPRLRPVPGEQAERVLDAGCLLVLDMRRHLHAPLPPIPPRLSSLRGQTPVPRVVIRGHLWRSLTPQSRPPPSSHPSVQVAAGQMPGPGRSTRANAGGSSGDNGVVMTLTQLNAFVLVARLGSVTAAANALGVSEPAVSQALSALRQHLGDQLVTRGPAGMTLTAGGSRLLSAASQIVVLGAEAHAAVRAAQGAPEQLRVVATSTVAEFVIGPLMEAFTRRYPGSVEVSVGVAVTKEMGVLVANRLADVAIS